MERLSLKSYGWKCVLGIEVFYVACLFYGGFLSGKAAALHHDLFTLIPGFNWLTTGSVIWGAIYLFIAAWIFAWYMVWMHNSSLVQKQ